METDNNTNTSPASRNPSFPVWASVAGATFGGITFVFFMVLVLMSIFDMVVPSTSKFLVVSVLALGVALALAFIGGDAAARGKLPIPYLNEKPIEFSVAGGIAVFIIVLLVGNAIYPVDPSPHPVENSTQVEYANLKIITNGVPPGATVIVSDENGDTIASTMTGLDGSLIIRLDKKYIGGEISVTVAAPGFSIDTKSVELSEESTIEFSW